MVGLLPENDNAEPHGDENNTKVIPIGVRIRMKTTLTEDGFERARGKIGVKLLMLDVFMLFDHQGYK